MTGYFRSRIFQTRLFATALAAAWLASSAAPAVAAVLSVTPPSVRLSAGSTFVATVTLDSQGETVNATEGIVRFSADVLTVEAIRDGGGIVTLWTERPACKGCEQGIGEIRFGGIMPGGYVGGSGEVFSIVFGAKKQGISQVSLADARVLKNDGKGTEAELALQMSAVTVADGRPETVVTPPDVTPPEPFIPMISSDPALFGGARFVAFAAQDKESGIDHYEIAYGKDPTPPQDDAAWAMAVSPTQVRSDDRSGFAFVRAVDRAGNRTVESVSLAEVPWYAGKKLAILCGGALLALALALLIWKQLCARKKTSSQ